MFRPAGAIALTLLIGAVSPSGTVYRQAATGYRYSFPRDHFDHPDFRTEWWYYTGNLHDTAGKRFGFELVFFRQGQRKGPIANRSAWRIDDLYLAHLAITDIDGHQFHSYRRLARAGPGIAGASFEQQRVWNGNWSAKWQGERQILEATADELHFRLDLNPSKRPVIHGVNGLSQKGQLPGEASHYVSFTRLIVSGELVLGAARHRIAGTAWMDHEWFTNQLSKDQLGWDWFSVQLDDQTELMLFQLRLKNGGIDPHSAGTYVDRNGQPQHLTRERFVLTPGTIWRSPATGARYPVHWQIRVPSLGLSLQCDAAQNSQELPSEDGAGPAYWEGAVTYTGSQSGSGYLEMIGYDKPVQMEP